MLNNNFIGKIKRNSVRTRWVANNQNTGQAILIEIKSMKFFHAIIDIISLWLLVGGGIYTLLSTTEIEINKYFL